MLKVDNGVGIDGTSALAELSGIERAGDRLPGSFIWQFLILLYEV